MITSVSRQQSKTFFAFKCSRSKVPLLFLLPTLQYVKSSILRQYREMIFIKYLCGWLFALYVEFGRVVKLCKPASFNAMRGGSQRYTCILPYCQVLLIIVNMCLPHSMYLRTRIQLRGSIVDTSYSISIIKNPSFGDRLMLSPITLWLFYD